ncbi:MAG: hypothetical protein QQN41_08520 [Nitrosopumilus sp.]
MINYEVVLLVAREETKTIDMRFPAPVHVGDYIYAENDEFKVTKITHQHDEFSVINAR